MNGSAEFSEIHIESGPAMDPFESRASTSSATNSLTRKRNFAHRSRSSDESDLDKLRKLVSEVEEERRNSGVGSGGSQRGSVEPSLMSAVFGVVLVIIISITVYAFGSLYHALVKRYYPEVS